MKEISKTEAIKKIEDFFSKINTKNSEDVKKIKKLAMRHNLTLKEKRKTFCKKCFTPYTRSKVRIKNKTKSVICEKCGYVSRWKIKTS